MKRNKGIWHKAIYYPCGTLREWIHELSIEELGISVMGMTKGLIDVFDRYKQILLSPDRNIPGFFVDNPKINEVFISIYETFTEYRNQAMHASGIDVDQDDNMTITFKNGTEKQVSSKEMEAALAFTTSLVDCLSELENGLQVETAKRKAYISAVALSSFHETSLPLLSATWWAKVYYSFNKTTEELQELQSIQIDLDAIKRFVFQHDAPADNETVYFEILINLQDFSDQPNYKIPHDIVEKGGVISIDRKDLLLNGTSEYFQKDN